MATTELATLKRTELQAAACRAFGKVAAAWTGRATNEELRQALTEGEPPARFANGNGSDLAVAIAAAINPLLQAQLDEARVMELIEARVAELATFVEAKLAERVNTFEVHRSGGSRINVGRTHKQFEELLSWVEAGCWPFLIGPAGSFKTSAVAKVAEALGRPFFMESMSEDNRHSICSASTMRQGKPSTQSCERRGSAEGFSWPTHEGTARCDLREDGQPDSTAMWCSSASPGER